MINWFKKQNRIDVSDINVLYSPMNGKLIDIKDVNDKTFSSGIMGRGIAIIPDSNLISAPIEGEIIMIFPTKHAIGIKGNNGCELIIHIGIDTVELKGEYFDCKVKLGDLVKPGQPLVDVQMNKIRAKGYDTSTMLVITNSNEFDINQLTTNSLIIKSEKLLSIVRKGNTIEN